MSVEQPITETHISELLHLRVSGTGVLPELSETIGYRDAMVYRVPTGKVFIPEAATVIGDTNLVIVRVARRFHLWAFSGATIAAPATIGAPVTVADAAYDMVLGYYTFKVTAINNVGETTPSAVSAAVQVTAATQAIGFTFAVPTGARRLRIYRTTAKASAVLAAAGPWYLLHEIDRAHPSPYRDIHGDDELDLTTEPPGANTTSGNQMVESVTNPISDPNFFVQDVALATTPTRFIYGSEDGFDETQEADFAVTMTVNTQTRVTLKRQSLGLTGVVDFSARSLVSIRGGDTHTGLTSIKAVLGNPATGQYNIYAYQPFMLAGGTVSSQGDKTSLRIPVVLPAGAECVVQIAVPPGGNGGSKLRQIALIGRLLSL